MHIQENNKIQVNKLSQSNQLTVIPSSFIVNPQFFNNRLIRIKQKIDSLIKEFASTDKQTIVQIKSEVNIQEKGNQTSRSNATIHRKTSFQIPIQRITIETKEKIKSIYNEIHELERAAMKDQNMVDTHTFELRSFLKDLRNQNKRLIKLIPEKVIEQMQIQKKAPYKKSFLKQNSKFQIEDQTNKQKDQILQAQQQIQAEFKKRRIFKEHQKFYEDKDNKCKLLTCQLI